MGNFLNFFELSLYLLDDNARFSFQMAEAEEFWNLLYNGWFGDDTLDQEMLEFHYLVWDLVDQLQQGQCMTDVSPVWSKSVQI